MPRTKPADQKVQSRGAKRMKERGHKAVMVWLDPHEYTLIVAAAQREGKALATWMRGQAFHAAQKSQQAAIDRQRPVY